MSKLLHKALRRLQTGLDHVATETIAIIDGDHAIEEIEAAPGRRDIVQYMLEGLAGQTKPLDWLVGADRLFFPSLGKKQEPKKGWEIWWSPSEGPYVGQTLVFAVLPMNNSCFEPVDQYGILYRVHTKLDRIVPKIDV